MSAIVAGHKKNLETLKRAFADNAVALVECRRVSDGQVVAMLCTMGWKRGEGWPPPDGEYLITPFAEMVNGDPFEMYRPPNPDGGFA